jgi:dCTP deaminase
MLLSDVHIREICPSIVHPYDADRVQPASYDLSLARGFLVPFHSNQLVEADGLDLRIHNPRDYMKEVDSPVWRLDPGHCVLGSTQQVITCPKDIAIRVEGKSSLARLFLLPHVAAGWIHPGFTGQVTLEIVNLGPWPIKLYEGMEIAQMNFTRMSTPVAVPYGNKALGSHYQGQMGPTSSLGKRQK